MTKHTHIDYPLYTMDELVRWLHRGVLAIPSSITMKWSRDKIIEMISRQNEGITFARPIIWRSPKPVNMARLKRIGALELPTPLCRMWLLDGAEPLLAYHALCEHLDPKPHAEPDQHDWLLGYDIPNNTFYHTHTPQGQPVIPPSKCSIPLGFTGMSHSNLFLAWMDQQRERRRAIKQGTLVLDPNEMQPDAQVLAAQRMHSRTLNVKVPATAIACESLTDALQFVDAMRAANGLPHAHHLLDWALETIIETGV